MCGVWECCRRSLVPLDPLLQPAGALSYRGCSAPAPSDSTCYVPGLFPSWHLHQKIQGGDTELNQKLPGCGTGLCTSGKWVTAPKSCVTWALFGKKHALSNFASEGASLFCCHGDGAESRCFSSSGTSTTALGNLTCASLRSAGITQFLVLPRTWVRANWAPPDPETLLPLQSLSLS